MESRPPALSIDSAFGDAQASPSTSPCARRSRTEGGLPCLQGWLEKQGARGLVRAWRKRWFCSDGDRLFYYARENDKESLGFVAMREVEQLKELGADQASSRKWSFALVTPNRIYNLCAATEVDYQTWMRQLTVWIGCLKAEPASLDDPEADSNGEGPWEADSDRVEPEASLAGARGLAQLRSELAAAQQQAQRDRVRLASMEAAVRKKDDLIKRLSVDVTSAHEQVERSRHVVALLRPLPPSSASPSFHDSDAEDERDELIAALRKALFASETRVRALEGNSSVEDETPWPPPTSESIPMFDTLKRGESRDRKSGSGYSMSGGRSRDPYGDSGTSTSPLWQLEQGTFAADTSPTERMFDNVDGSPMVDTQPIPEPKPSQTIRARRLNTTPNASSSPSDGDDRQLGGWLSPLGSPSSGGGLLAQRSLQRKLGQRLKEKPRGSQGHTHLKSTRSADEITLRPRVSSTARRCDSSVGLLKPRADTSARPSIGKPLAFSHPGRSGSRRGHATIPGGRVSGSFSSASPYPSTSQRFQEQVVSQLRSHQFELLKRLEEMERERALWNAQLEQHQDRITNSEKLLDAKTAEWEAVRQAYDAEKQTREQLERRCLALEERDVHAVRDTRDQTERHVALIEELERERDDNSGMVFDLRERVADLEQQLRELSTLHSVVEGANQDEDSDAGRRRTLQARLMAALQEKKALTAEVGKEVAYRQALEKRMEQQSDLHTVEVSRLRDQLNTLTQRCAAQRATLQQLQAQAQAHSDAVVSMEAMLKSKNEQLAEVQATSPGTTSMVRLVPPTPGAISLPSPPASSDLLPRTDGAALGTVPMLRSDDAGVESLRAKCARLEAELADKEQQLAAHREAQSERDETLSLREDQMVALKQAIATLRKELKAKDEHIRSLDRQVRHNRRQGASTNHLLVQHSEAESLTKLREAIEAHQMQNSLLAAELEHVSQDYEVRLRAKERKIDQLNQEVEQLRIAYRNVAKATLKA